MPEPVYWMDLSGAELRARLVQRGVSPWAAGLLDDDREYYEEEITQHLGTTAPET